MSQKPGLSSSSINKNEVLENKYDGALYHCTTRGNERRPIYYCKDAGFHLFLNMRAEVCDRFNWVIHSFCLMTNHYHLVVETPDANLSRGMRQLNGIYTIRFNRKYRRSANFFRAVIKRSWWIKMLTLWSCAVT